MGIVPLQYLDGQNAESLSLTGKEEFTIDVPEDLKPQQEVEVKTANGKSLSEKRTWQLPCALLS